MGVVVAGVPLLVAVEVFVHAEVVGAWLYVEELCCAVAGGHHALDVVALVEQFDYDVTSCVAFYCEEQRGIFGEGTDADALLYASVGSAIEVGEGKGVEFEAVLCIRFPLTLQIECRWRGTADEGSVDIFFLLLRPYAEAGFIPQRVLPFV